MSLTDRSVHLLLRLLKEVLGTVLFVVGLVTILLADKFWKTWEKR